MENGKEYLCPFAYTFMRPHLFSFLISPVIYLFKMHGGKELKIVCEIASHEKKALVQDFLIIQTLWPQQYNIVVRSIPKPIFVARQPVFAAGHFVEIFRRNCKFNWKNKHVLLSFALDSMTLKDFLQLWSILALQFFAIFQFFEWHQSRCNFSLL